MNQTFGVVIEVSGLLRLLNAICNGKTMIKVLRNPLYKYLHLDSNQDPEGQGFKPCMSTNFIIQAQASGTLFVFVRTTYTNWKY